MEQSFLVRHRAVIVSLVLLGIFVGVGLSGVVDDVTPETIREMVQSAGVWGVALFVLIFALGELIHIPGMVFVFGGVLAYGRGAGFAVGLLGAVVSVTVSFLIVRKFGGQALDKLRWSFLQKMLARLERRPVSTVVALRSLLWLAPPLNFALAMSRVRFRDYVIGSAIGLLGPIAIMSFFFEELMTFVGSNFAG